MKNVEKITVYNPELQPYIDFAIIGGTKAGTTSLYSCFKRHPAVSVPRIKEPHYFSQGLFGPDFFGLDREYASASDYNQLFRAHGGQKKGDFDPLTLHGPNAIDLLLSANPNVKLIVILRNPIERAWSHYQMETRECFENRNFEEAIVQETEKWKAGNKHYCPLIQLGFYSTALKNFKERVGEKQVSIFLHEDLAGRPNDVRGKLCSFLGLSYADMPAFDSIRENAASRPKNRMIAELLNKRRYGLFRILRDHMYLKMPEIARRWIRECIVFKPASGGHMSTSAWMTLEELYRSDLGALEEVLGRNFHTGGPAPSLRGTEEMRLPQDCGI